MTHFYEKQSAGANGLGVTDKFPWQGSFAPSGTWQGGMPNLGAQQQQPNIFQQQLAPSSKLADVGGIQQAMQKFKKMGNAMDNNESKFRNLMAKHAAQDNSVDSRSSAGEGKGVTYKTNDDDHATGTAAWDSIGQYMKSANEAFFVPAGVKLADSANVDEYIAGGMPARAAIKKAYPNWSADQIDAFMSTYNKRAEDAKHDCDKEHPGVSHDEWEEKSAADELHTFMSSISQEKRASLDEFVRTSSTPGEAFELWMDKEGIDKKAAWEKLAIGWLLAAGRGALQVGKGAVRHVPKLFGAGSKAVKSVVPHTAKTIGAAPKAFAKGFSRAGSQGAGFGGRMSRGAKGAYQHMKHNPFLGRAGTGGSGLRKFLQYAPVTMAGMSMLDPFGGGGSATGQPGGSFGGPGYGPEGAGGYGGRFQGGPIGYGTGGGQGVAPWQTHQQQPGHNPEGVAPTMQDQRYKAGMDKQALSPGALLGALLGKPSREAGGEGGAKKTPFGDGTNMLGPNVDIFGRNKWDRAGKPTPGGKGPKHFSDVKKACDKLGLTPYQLSFAIRVHEANLSPQQIKAGIDKAGEHMGEEYVEELREGMDKIASMDKEAIGWLRALGTGAAKYGRPALSGLKNLFAKAPKGQADRLAHSANKLFQGTKPSVRKGIERFAETGAKATKGQDWSKGLGLTGGPGGLMRMVGGGMTGAQAAGDDAPWYVKAPAILGGAAFGRSMPNMGAGARAAGNRALWGGFGGAAADEALGLGGIDTGGRFGQMGALGGFASPLLKGQKIPGALTASKLSAGGRQLNPLAGLAGKKLPNLGFTASGARRAGLGKDLANWGKQNTGWMGTKGLRGATFAPALGGMGMSLAQGVGGAVNDYVDDKVEGARSKTEQNIMNNPQVQKALEMADTGGGFMDSLSGIGNVVDPLLEMMGMDPSQMNPLMKILLMAGGGLGIGGLLSGSKGAGIGGLGMMAVPLIAQMMKQKQQGGGGVSPGHSPGTAGVDPNRVAAGLPDYSGEAGGLGDITEMDKATE